jgi:hypothetical protein
MFVLVSRIKNQPFFKIKWTIPAALDDTKFDTTW